MTGDESARLPRSSNTLRVALAARGVVERADEFIALGAPKDRPGLIVLMFHCLFEDGVLTDGAIDPHEQATPDRLARLFVYLRDKGYRFVSATEIDRGLAPGGLYAHLTFDDGFANNLALIDLLRREEVYATVFPSADHVRTGRAYWWNVVYRERTRRGQGEAIAAEYAYLRRLTSKRVEEYLVKSFGRGAMRPGGDIDRPLTVEELRDLGASPWIEIGNHTLSHAILPNHPATAIREEISGAQAWLAETIGSEPFVIAYPNGNTSDEVVEIALDVGLRLGVTVDAFRNRLPLSADARMRIGRFRIVFDGRAAARMRTLRSSIQLAGPLRAAVLRS